MSTSAWEKAAAGISVALIVSIFVLLAVGQAECSARGGAYVRGLAWFECVDPR